MVLKDIMRVDKECITSQYGGCKNKKYSIAKERETVFYCIQNKPDNKIQQKTKQNPDCIQMLS